jgi:hypothetical protein
MLASPAIGQSTVGAPGGTKGTPQSEAMSSQGSFAEIFNTRALMGDPAAAGALYGRTEAIAKCLARRGDKAGGLIGGVLAGDPAYNAITRALDRQYAYCNRDDRALPPMLVSGVLAEQLVMADGAPAYSDRAVAVDVNGAEKFFGGLDGNVSLDSVAGCIAVYSPGLLKKVFSTTVGTAEESAALNALYAATPECGVAAQPTDIPSIYQRAALATALYEWSHKNS